MRELTLRETCLPIGGRSEEFRTILRHEITRWEEPPNHWTLTPESPPETGPEHSIEPVPLHWLPCRDEWPELF